MKQTQIDRINRWCKYNAECAVYNATHPLKVHVTHIDEDFMIDYAYFSLFIKRK